MIGLLGWDDKAGLRRDAISSQRLTRSRRNGKEVGHEEEWHRDDKVRNQAMNINPVPLWRLS
jgi:hypothetical protein